jgi:hypothetical protein
VRLLGAEQRINQRRLAYIRAAEKGDLGRAEGLRRGREVGGVGGGEQEDRGQSHRSSLVHAITEAVTRA